MPRRCAHVHCVANGFGSDGPYAGRAAYDDAIQAASGYADLIGRVQGRPGYSPAVVADKVCALHVTQAVMAALFFRERSGCGQAIEVPMFETMVAFNLAEHHGGAIYEPPLGDIGYVRALSPFRRPYRCADGWACLMPSPSSSDPSWPTISASPATPTASPTARSCTACSTSSPPSGQWASGSSSVRRTPSPLRR